MLNPEPVGNNPIAAFHAWIVERHGALYLHRAQLDARTRELYPLARSCDQRCGISDEYTQLCVEHRADQLEFELFDSCFLLAKAGECKDFLPVENPVVAQLFERFERERSEATSSHCALSRSS